MYPHYNGEVSMEFGLGEGSATTTIQAGFDNVRKIVITSSSTYAFDATSSITGEARFQYPLKVRNDVICQGLCSSCSEQI